MIAFTDRGDGSIMDTRSRQKERIVRFPPRSGGKSSWKRILETPNGLWIRRQC